MKNEYLVNTCFKYKYDDKNCIYHITFDEKNFDNIRRLVLVVQTHKKAMNLHNVNGNVPFARRKINRDPYSNSITAL